MRFAGIVNVKSREDLVMSNTDLTTIANDPFGQAPFPKGNNSEYLCKSFITFSNYGIFGFLTALLDATFTIFLSHSEPKNFVKE